MENFRTMISLQVTLLVYVLVGVLCYKKEIISLKGQKDLAKYVTLIGLPCMIFTSFRQKITLAILQSSVLIMVISLVTILFNFALGKLLFSRVPEGRKEVMQHGLMFSNSGFAGLPQAERLFGEQGVFYGSMYLLPFRILLWSLGLSLYITTDFKQACKKIVTNPGILAVFLGIFHMFLPVQLPDPVFSALTAIGTTATSLSMVVIGMALAQTPLSMVLDKQVLFLTVTRLILSPALVLLVLRGLNLPSIIVGVSVLLSSMPVGTTTGLMAQMYDKNPLFASACIFTSTLLSFFTVPVFMLLIS